LTIGDYATFFIEDIHFCIILGFQYLTGGRKDYSLEHCPINPQIEECDKKGVVISKNVTEFLNIDFYLSH
jgi:hypothetical protein